MEGSRIDLSALIVSSILPYPAASGGQLRTLRLLEAIDEAGARPHLLVASGGERADARPLMDRGWKVEIFDQPRSGLMGRLRQHAARLPSPFNSAVDWRVRQIVSAGVSFVQFENAQNFYYVGAAAGRPIVLSTHNVDAELLASLAAGAPAISRERFHLRVRARAMATTERRAARRCDAVLCVSEQDVASFRSIGAKRVLLVSNGIDDQFFEIGPPPTYESLLFFGLLSYQPNAQGIGRFLREGWPELIRSRPGARLRIAGTGAGRELRELVERTEGVELLGRVPSMVDELARASVVLVPIWQGAGTRLKVLESLGAGRPIVGTSLGVERIGFEAGRHGLVADHPRGLALAAAELLGDPVHARALASEGRELAERYRWSKVLEPARQLYGDWLTGGRSPGQR
jgi:glycosyltransferase involved in cell wall biosynthesis